MSNCVPDRSVYDPLLGATLHTGSCAVDAGARFAGGALATDTETPGLDRAFDINCVTMAWTEAGRVQSILLDPARVPAHARLARDMYDRADSLILHNAPFDAPGLWHAGLLSSATVNRIIDTLVLARFAFPDTMVRKSLESLAIAHLGWTDFADGMKRAFHAAGYRTIQAGYENMDIDSPIYRQGAMADTVATLALEPVLRSRALHWSTDHPFVHYGATDAASAAELLSTQETVSRVMLRRTARGLGVDTDYLDRYSVAVEAERAKHTAALSAAGLAGGSGKAGSLVEYLDKIGELPDSWPRTPTGKLKATKDLIESLEHPLADAQRALAVTDKVTGYLAKVTRQAEVTGRCHPQVGVLGASATGRMAYGSPELQQFPADARGVITDTDGTGLTSIDWCFDGDTMVETIYNGVKRIRDITPGEHVWSWKDGRCVVGTVTAATKTLDWAECVEVLLDNGKSVVCTANHPWLLNVGTYIRADHLTPGMSLAAFRRTTDAYGYEAVYSRSAFEYTKTHRAVGEHVHGPLPDGWHTHHVNEDKLDNRPENLEYLTASDHARLTPITDARRAASAANALKMVAGRRSYEGAGNPNHGKLKGEYRTCEHCDIEFYVSRANLNRGQGRFCNRACYDAARSRKTNHKVVATRIVASRPVWDITVEGEHNFALEAGVFVHNCQIEPVTMALMAKDTAFLAPFEAGADLYEPIQRAAGVSRPVAKVVLLATMYGQGTNSLAAAVGHSPESAAQIRRQMLAAMPGCARWMSKVQEIAAQYGRTITAAGRILPVDPGFDYKAVNYTIQGSALDVLHHTIVEMERRGIADELHLAMHDELVVSTPVAEEVRQIMQTPPEFLTRWAGRTTTLRTDSEELGGRWKKV